MVSNIFYFHPYLGKIPILTNIFQLGWNHQLVIILPDIIAILMHCSHCPDVGSVRSWDRTFAASGFPASDAHILLRLYPQRRVYIAGQKSHNKCVVKANVWSGKWICYTVMHVLSWSIMTYQSCSILDYSCIFTFKIYIKLHCFIQLWGCSSIHRLK